jgi:hypothetical protein
MDHGEGFARDTSRGVVYQVHQGLTGKGILGLCGFGLCAAFGWIVMSHPPDLLDIANQVICGTGAGAIAVGVRRKIIGVRVDEIGITLGTPDPWTRNRKGWLTPWEEIDAVILCWKSDETVTYIGIKRKAHLESRTHEPLTNVNEAMIPNVSQDILNLSTPERGWHLDKDRLNEAIKANAPQVSLIDMREEEEKI